MRSLKAQWGWALLLRLNISFGWKTNTPLFLWLLQASVKPGFLLFLYHPQENLVFPLQRRVSTQVICVFWRMGPSLLFINCTSSLGLSCESCFFFNLIRRNLCSFSTGGLSHVSWNIALGVGALTTRAPVLSWAAVLTAFVSLDRRSLWSSAEEGHRLSG